MSDGPHRSLPMRKPWKVVAERADLSAFERDEIAESIKPALADDWDLEMPAALISKLRSLFPEDSLLPVRPEDIECLRSMAAGSPLGDLVVSSAACCAEEGLGGPSGLEEAVGRALCERALQGVRQIEEHYRRESSDRRAKNVRCRMESAIDLAGLKGLAAQLASAGGPGTARQIPKHSDLDDGASLR